jgi:hypothetical protein
MSEHFLGSYKGFEILANLGLDPLVWEEEVQIKARNKNNDERHNSTHHKKPSIM